MNLRSALFFSSKRAAHYDRQTITIDDTRFYHLKIEIKSEEFTPLFTFGTTGPYYRDVFHVAVSRRQDREILAPHAQYQFYSIDDAEELFKAWKIEIDYCWVPDEDSEEQAA